MATILPEVIRTIPFGILRNSKPRLEKIARVTKTLIVTDKARYNRQNGMPADYYNKSVGAYRLSEKDLKEFNKL